MFPAVPEAHPRGAGGRGRRGRGRGRRTRTRTRTGREAVSLISHTRQVRTTVITTYILVIHDSFIYGRFQ